jgi:hypothetical protein
VPPSQLFRSARYAGRFSQWADDTGLPTLDAEGKELSNSAKKVRARLRRAARA